MCIHPDEEAKFAKRQLDNPTGWLNKDYEKWNHIEGLKINEDDTITVAVYNSSYDAGLNEATSDVPVPTVDDKEKDIVLDFSFDANQQSH